MLCSMSLLGLLDIICQFIKLLILINLKHMLLQRKIKKKELIENQMNFHSEQRT